MSVCDDCQSSFGCIMGRKPTPCANKELCNKLLCTTCAGTHALIPFDASNPDESNDLDKNSTIQSYCKTCFRQVSVLDYSKSYDDIGNEQKQQSQHEGARNTKNSNSITFLMAHGGGGSRAMFRPHAEFLAQQKGYRCILMDLPGHGTLVDEPLTLDACVDAVVKVYHECNLSKETTIYVGASLGAYIGFYVLDKLKEEDHFCGAILMDCGQNVGPDCSLKARLGVWFLQLAASHMSNKTLMEAMLGVTKKSPARYRLNESVFGAGMFFQQGTAQTVCMHAVAPAKHIPNLEFPILFFNGSEDYRDSEDKWLSLCQDQDRSALHVYQGGDHFFTHDERFLNDLLDRIDAFSKAAAAAS